MKKFRVNVRFERTVLGDHECVVLYNFALEPQTEAIANEIDESLKSGKLPARFVSRVEGWIGGGFKATGWQYYYEDEPLCPELKEFHDWLLSAPYEESK